MLLPVTCTVLQEDLLKEPTPAPAEYEYGQQDLSYMFDMNMYTYLGMCLTMTYLRKYAYTSLGMSFLMGAFAQVHAMLIARFFPSCMSRSFPSNLHC